MALLGIYLVAASLLALAGVAKALRPADTARALVDLADGRAARAVTLRRLVWVVRVAAAAEGALGLVGLAYPHAVVAALVAASYVAFTAFVLYARAQGGALATCGCFGSPDTPPTVLHAVIDACLAAGAIGLCVAAPTGTIAGVLERQSYDGVPLVVASALTAALAYAVLVPMARLTALRHLEPTGHLDMAGHLDPAGRR